MARGVEVLSCRGMVGVAPWPDRRRRVGAGRRFCWWWGSLVGSSRVSSITRRGRSAALRFVWLERFDGSVFGRFGLPAVEACRPNGVPAVLGCCAPLERSCRAGLGLVSLRPVDAQVSANLSARLTGRCARSGSVRSFNSVLPSWLGLARPCRAGLSLTGPGRSARCPTFRL